MGGPMGVTSWGGGGGGAARKMVFFFKRNDQISSKLGRNHP